MHSTVVATSFAATADHPPIYSDTAKDLLEEKPAVTPDITNQQVFKTFTNDTDLKSLSVIENGRPIGLINRHLFMEEFARPFMPELYQNKSCIAFMDKHPLVVEQDTPIEQISAKILAVGEKVLSDGFIITSNGLYRGMGRAQEVLAAMSRMQEEKSRIVMESIDYGSVIQRSISRASRKALAKGLNEQFLVWEPRDTVSGDLYHFVEFEDGFLGIVFDCTGHGVPGAFMTLIMTAFLQGSINAESAKNPGALLAEVHRRVRAAMSKSVEGFDEQHADDGMDAAVFWLERDARTLIYAGAHMPLFLLAPTAKDFEVINGDREGVGYANVPLSKVWNNHTIKLTQSTAVYFFTDGLFDQLGGSKCIAFGKRRTRKTLLKLRDAPMAKQAEGLMKALAEYQGDEPRRDDICALGFRV